LIKQSNIVNRKTHYKDYEGDIFPLITPRKIKTQKNKYKRLLRKWRIFLRGKDSYNPPKKMKT